jgi:hypothetical protein
MPYRLAKTFGGKGSGRGQFPSAITGLALGAQGRLLVSGGPHVQVFDSETGVPLARWPAGSPALSVAVDSSQRIFTGHEGCIEIHNAAGVLLDTWKSADRLGQVTSIAFAKDSIYAADSRNRLIRRYSPSGQWMNDIGGDNPTRGFVIPNGILTCAADAPGVLHAANPGKHRIERYSPDGKLLSKAGKFDQLDPAGFPGCCNPTYLALDAKGNLYVTEKAPPRVKALNPDGSLISVIATTDLDPLAKNCPIVADARGRVFVADTVRLVIHVYEPTSTEKGL